MSVSLKWIDLGTCVSLTNDKQMIDKNDTK